METQVSTVTPRQTVTPNKDIVGEEREDVNRLNKGEATVMLYSVCVCVCVRGGVDYDEGVPGDKSPSLCLRSLHFHPLQLHKGSHECGQSVKTFLFTQKGHPHICTVYIAQRNNHSLYTDSFNSIQISVGWGCQTKIGARI